MTTVDTHRANVEYLAGLAMDGEPMFPMLRRLVHSGPACRDCVPSDRRHIVYSDAPMNALLGRIRELGLTPVLDEDGEWQIWLAAGGVFASDKGTYYERLIDALAQATKAAAK
jgi:hypothetical protein